MFWASQGAIHEDETSFDEPPLTNHESAARAITGHSENPRSMQSHAARHETTEMSRGSGFAKADDAVDRRL